MSSTLLARPSGAGSLLLTLLSKHPDARIEHRARGEVILHSFIEQDNVYIVKSGFVKVYTIENSGESKVQLVHSAGEIFPVAGLLNQRTVDGDNEFEAMTDCTVVRLPRKTVRQLLKERHDLSQIFLEQVTKQFTICVAWVRNLSFKHARERLAYRLLYMAYRHGIEAENGAILLPEFNQMQIAETINMTRECVNRELHNFERAGILACYENRIFIRNPEKLRKEAELENEQFIVGA